MANCKNPTADTQILIRAERWQQLSSSYCDWDDRCPTPQELDALIRFISVQDEQISLLRAELKKLKKELKEFKDCP